MTAPSIFFFQSVWLIAPSRRTCSVFIAVWAIPIYCTLEPSYSAGRSQPISHRFVSKLDKRDLPKNHLGCFQSGIDGVIFVKKKRATGKKYSCIKRCLIWGGGGVVML